MSYSLNIFCTIELTINEFKLRIEIENCEKAKERKINVKKEETKNVGYNYFNYIRERSKKTSNGIIAGNGR